MNQKLLLPNRFKTIGWILLIPSVIVGLILMSGDFEKYVLLVEVPTLFPTDFALFSEEVLDKIGPFSIIRTNITNTIVGTFFIIGALMVAFSKEKQEDEFISNLRLSSLLWSVWVNYVLLLLGFLLIYGIAFMHVMIYNMFTILIIFIIRFNYMLYRSANAVADEK